MKAMDWTKKYSYNKKKKRMSLLCRTVSSVPIMLMMKFLMGTFISENCIRTVASPEKLKASGAALELEALERFRLSVTSW
jgi:hypothetical protein